MMAVARKQANLMGRTDADEPGRGAADSTATTSPSSSLAGKTATSKHRKVRSRRRRWCFGEVTTKLDEFGRNPAYKMDLSDDEIEKAGSRKLRDHRQIYTPPNKKSQ